MLSELRVQNLTWQPQGRRHPTLNDVTFTFPPGARVAVLGSSGAGKSTLLRALAGVLAESGTGELTGIVQVPTAGLLLQEPLDCVVAQTAGRDVAFGPENAGLARDVIWRRVDRAMARSGFPYGPQRSTTELSGGQLQRLMLAGALATEPGMLLLDEPTAMLDDDAAATVRQAVAEAVQDGSTALFVVEHRIGPWLDLLDHALVLGPGGTVVAAGELDAVLRDQRAEVLDSGAWLPDLASPEPVPLPSGLIASSPVDREPVLRFDDAAVRRGDDLVGGARFEVRRGEMLAITGPSGSGKSTTLELLTGQLAPDAGRVEPAVSELPADQVAQLVSLVVQHPSRSFIGSTVLQEVLVTPTALGIDATERAHALLEHLKLAHLAQASPHSLSGGEQRRLSLAAALVVNPAVVALDEPTVGLDRHAWAVVTGILESAAAQGTAVVAATHDRHLVSRCEQQVRLPEAVLLDSAAEEPVSSSRRVARCRPLALLIAAGLAAVASLWIRDPRTAVVGLALMLTLMPLYAPAPRIALRRALPVSLAAVMVGWSSWLLGSHDLTVAGVAMARILCMVLPGALLLAHIRPSQLGDDLAQRLRLPARAVVACVVALQRVDQLQLLWHLLARNRRSRGLDAGGANLLVRVRTAVALTFSLLVESLRGANVTAVAMDARGFAHAQRRTWAEPATWAGRDTLAVMAGLAYLAVMMGVSLTA